MKLTNASSVPYKLEFSVDSGTAVIFVAAATNDTGSAVSDVTNAGASNGVTKVDIIAAPAANETRIIDYVNIYNGDTVTRTITINYDVNATDRVVGVWTLAAGEMLQYAKGTGWYKTAGVNSVGYTLSVQALTSSPTDSQTVYFGNLPKAPVTVDATSRVYIPKAGTIKRAEIYCYSGTAGSNENWTLYVRLNGASDTTIATVGAATNQRIFSNSALSITVAAGDYFEIKGVQPAWGTNPLTTIYGGYVYIE